MNAGKTFLHSGVILASWRSSGDQARCVTGCAPMITTTYFRIWTLLCCGWCVQNRYSLAACRLYFISAFSLLMLVHFCVHYLRYTCANNRAEPWPSIILSTYSLSTFRHGGSEWYGLVILGCASDNNGDKYALGRYQAGNKDTCHGTVVRQLLWEMENSTVLLGKGSGCSYTRISSCTGYYSKLTLLQTHGIQSSSLCGLELCI